MFFRREPVHTPSLAERLDKLRQAGFTVSQSPGGVRASRGQFAVDLKTDPARGGGVSGVGRAGILMDGEIGVLVDAGFQKFFRTPGGKQKPATAADLAPLHEFEEDLCEGLGRDSYYNESLGTVSTYYLYDRVQNRDRGVPKRAWE